MSDEFAPVSKVINEKITKKVSIIWIDPALEDVGLMIFPPLQAYRDSPNWRPVLTVDGVIYVWNSSEATVIPRCGRTWILMWRSRESKRILATFVNPRIPGNRHSNVFRSPEDVMPTSKVMAAAAILVFGDNMSWIFPSDPAIRIANPEKTWYQVKLANEVCTITAEITRIAGDPPTEITIEFRLRPQFGEIREGKEFVDEQTFDEFRKWVDAWRPGL